jgi:hypothetical protein
MAGLDAVPFPAATPLSPVRYDITAWPSRTSPAGVVWATDKAAARSVAK